MPSAFRVAFVPGVTLGKWQRVWQERRPREQLAVLPVEVEEQTSVLHDGLAEMCFVRLPVDDAAIQVIPLYYETPVVVVAKDHPVAGYDEVPLADLAHEHLLQDPDDVPEWRDVATEVGDGTRPPLPDITLRQAIETVAAGTGIVIVPQSVARLNNRRDVVYRPVLGIRETQIGLAWLKNLDDSRVEAFIGIVRGRTERSSRG